jgi:hypothetical protein
VPFGSRPQSPVETGSQGCPRTCAQRHSLSRPTVFSAFPRLPESLPFCQPFCFHSHTEPHITHGSRLKLEEQIKGQPNKSGVREIAAAQILKDQPMPNRKTAQANFGLQGTRRIAVLGSCNGIVLCGIPYRGSGALASPVPTNRLLCPLRAGCPLKPGHSRSSTADKQLSETITALSEMQANAVIQPDTQTAYVVVPNLCTSSLPSASELRDIRLQLSEISKR